MKKTLVALAALAVVSASAFAQSSVTLYGRIDASIGSQKQSNVNGTAADLDAGVQVRSGAHTGSRWGLRGSEDLGGGLRAIFQLEQGFNIDTGAPSSTREFHRQAFVGLSGGFGTIEIGRQYDTIDQMYANYDAMGSSGFSANGALSTFCSATASAASAQTTGLGARGLGDCVVRQDNAIQYTTPAMGGFGAKLMWAPGEDKGVASAGRATGGQVFYANGPIGVGAGYQSNKASGASTISNYMVGASYDFGVAKLYGAFEGGRNKNAAVNGKDNGAVIGVVAPLGAFTLLANYARENNKTAGAKFADSTGLGLMGQYALSKRTYTYAAYRNLEVDFSAAGRQTEKQRTYGVGVVHNF